MAAENCPSSSEDAKRAFFMAQADLTAAIYGGGAGSGGGGSEGATLAAGGGAGH